MLDIYRTAVGAPLYVLSAPHFLLGVSSFEPFLLISIVPALMASLVITEREQGMPSSLGVTLLNAQDVAHGKVLAARRLLLPLILGIITGKVIAYLSLIVLGLPMNGVMEVLTASNPLPLILSVVDLLFALHFILHFAIFGALSQSSPLLTVISSYAAVLLIWFIISFYCLVLTIPLAALGGMTHPLAHRVVMYLFFIFLVAATKSSSAGSLSRQMTSAP